MKIFELSILLLGMAFFQVACSKSKASAPLTPDVGTPMGLSLSKNQGMDGTKAHLQPTIIYTTLSAPVSPAFSTSLSFFQKLPEDFDDNIESFTLDKNFMATFADNVDGTGESICYVAAVSNITENLPERIKNKASFVRFIPINNVPKKGTCNTNINAVNALQSAWFYNWGLSQTTTATLQYVPMTWGKNAASLEQASNFIGRFGLDHILSFNEPDNSNQSNIASIDTAINRYKLLLSTGLRMGSPATEQDNIWDTKWQSQFISAAYVQKMRVDFLAVH